MPEAFHKVMGKGVAACQGVSSNVVDIVEPPVWPAVQTVSDRIMGAVLHVVEDRVGRWSEIGAVGSCGIPTDAIARREL